MATRPEPSKRTGRERRTRRNGLAWLAWMFVFTASFLIGGRIFRHADWAPDAGLAIVLSLVPVVPGALAFRTFLKLVREADEMFRAMLIDGLVFGFGAVMLFWGAVQLPEHVWLPQMKADWVIAVLLLGICGGAIRAQWRRT